LTPYPHFLPWKIQLFSTHRAKAFPVGFETEIVPKYLKSG